MRKLPTKVTVSIQRKKHNNNKLLTDTLPEDSEAKENNGMAEVVVQVHKISEDRMTSCNDGYLTQRYFKKHGAKKLIIFFFVLLLIYANRAIQQTKLEAIDTTEWLCVT
jgi:hypothetical protein